MTSFIDARNRYLDWIKDHPKTVAIILAVVIVVAVIAMIR
jgi:hypothetical protein